MNGQTGQATAASLIARSRRPARATAAMALLRLTGGTALLPLPGRGVAALVPAASAASARSPQRGHPSDVTAQADPGLADPAPADVPSSAGWGEGVRPDGRGARGGWPRPSGPAPAIGARPGSLGSEQTLGPAFSAGLSSGVPAGSSSAAPDGPPSVRTGGLPGRGADTASTARVAVPAIRARVSGSAPADPHRVIAPSCVPAVSPLVDRVRRPAPSAAAPDAGQASESAANEPVTVAPPVPGRTPAGPAPAVPAPPASPHAMPPHPPVTIGEIHVHVAEPAPAGADPLALLAPYARGLTARRDGAL